MTTAIEVDAYSRPLDDLLAEGRQLLEERRRRRQQDEDKVFLLRQERWLELLAAVEAECGELVGEQAATPPEDFGWGPATIVFRPFGAGRIFSRWDLVCGQWRLTRLHPTHDEPAFQVESEFAAEHDPDLRQGGPRALNLITTTSFAEAVAICEEATASYRTSLVGMGLATL